MTATPLADLAHLDFPTPELPCQWVSLDEGRCDQAADWIITCTILDHGQPIHTSTLLTCTGHKDAMLAHRARCDHCPQLVRVDSVEAIG